MRSCLYLWTCETSSVVTQVLFQFKVQIQPSTVKIPGCVLAPPLLSRMHQEVTCANLRQPGIPECISHQSASVNGGGGENHTFFKYYCYCVMKCHSKSISGENVRRWFRKRELHAITGRSVLMYPPRAFSPRLVLLTSAAGSDISVAVKHEVKLVFGLSNRQSLVSRIYYFFQVILFWLSTKLCFINYLFINRNRALTFFFTYIWLNCLPLFPIIQVSYHTSTFIMAIIVL